MAIIGDLKEIRYKIIDLRIRDFEDNKMLEELARLKSVINDTFSLIKIKKIPISL